MNFDLSEAEIEAGRVYVDALMDLGFRPEVACWTTNIPVDDAGIIIPNAETSNILAIVSSVVERVGAQQIYELLYKAYDAAITPAEIDPFNVSLYGPHSYGGDLLMRELLRLATSGKSEEIDKVDGDSPTGALLVLSEFQPSFKMTLHPRGIYAVNSTSNSATADLKRFRRFKSQIDRLAA